MNAVQKYQSPLMIGSVVVLLLVSLIAWKALSSRTSPLSFVDGAQTQLGVFHNSSIENGVKSFSSDMLGVSLDYPSNYLLFQRDAMLPQGLEIHTLIITPEVHALEAIECFNKPGCDGHPPASIDFVFYREPDTNISLEEWILIRPNSNFDPSDPAQEGILTPTKVAEVSAFRYQVRGLYDFDYIAFKYGQWVVLSSLPRGMGENFPSDFQAILASMQLK